MLFENKECETIYEGVLTYGMQTSTVTYIEAYRS